MTAHGSQETAIFDLMRWSHDYLDTLYDEVLEAVESDATDVQQRWHALNTHVLAHLNTERYVFDLLASIDAREAAELTREHGEIRSRLEELGVQLDLHCLRSDAVRSFIETLRAHAGREDNLLYRWADDRLEDVAGGSPA